MADAEEEDFASRTVELETEIQKLKAENKKLKEDAELAAGGDSASRTVELETEIAALKEEIGKLKQDAGVAEPAEEQKDSEEAKEKTPEKEKEDDADNADNDNNNTQTVEPDSPPPANDETDVKDVTPPKSHPSASSSSKSSKSDKSSKGSKVSGKSAPPPTPSQQPADDEAAIQPDAEREPEPELEPEPEVLPYSSPPPATSLVYRDIVSPMPPTPILQPPLAQRLPEHHKDIISLALTAFNDKWLLRQKMEVWVAFVVQRQQLRTKWESNMRGAILIHQFTHKLLIWRAYHTWRLWFTMRRRNPQAFGMVPRALIYDPAEPEVGDIETIKERITYHNNEINELSNTLRRHGEVVELLKTALKKRLDDEMMRLQHQTANLLHDKQLWGNESEVANPIIEYHDQQQLLPPVSESVLSHPVPTDPLAVAVPSPGPVISPPAPDLFSTPYRGYISKGSDSCPPRWLTIEEARIQAIRDPHCQGITYNVRQSAPGGRFLIYFKQKNDVHIGSSGWCSYTRDNTTLGGAAVASTTDGNNELQSVTTAVGGQLAIVPAMAATPPELRSNSHSNNNNNNNNNENYEVTPIVVSQPISPLHTRSPPQKLTDPCTVIKRLNLDPFQRRRLINFYQGYNPSKLPSVIHTLHEFCGHEEALFKALTEQYGPEPPLLSPSLPPGWRLTESSKGDLFYKHVSGKKQWQFP